MVDCWRLGTKDLFRGKKREHDDIDIVILREDHLNLHKITESIKNPV